MDKINNQQFFGCRGLLSFVEGREGREEKDITAKALTQRSCAGAEEEKKEINICSKASLSSIAVFDAGEGTRERFSF